MVRFFSVLVALWMTTPLASAGDVAIEVLEAYARASSPSASSGAAFMVLKNLSDRDDRLISAESDVAQRVELHTHLDVDGVMKMRAIEGGIALPAGGAHELARGGDHVMLMGLTNGLVDGQSIQLTLEFEKAGRVTIDVPVDLSRKPAAHKRHGDHGS